MSFPSLNPPTYQPGLILNPENNQQSSQKINELTRRIEEGRQISRILTNSQISRILTNISTPLSNQAREFSMPDGTILHLPKPPKPIPNLKISKKNLNDIQNLFKDKNGD